VQPTRIPEVHTLADVIQYWEEGAPEKGLTTPLKDWETIFQRPDYRTEATKLSNIKFVYREWAIHCERNDAIFDVQYGELRNKYTALRKKILKARQERGEAEIRIRRR
jgi:hypothetical protein